MRNKEIFKRDNFTCQKCGFKDPTKQSLEIHHINPKFNKGKNNQKNLIVLCSICHKHAPDNAKEFKKYIKEKIDSSLLDTFRKSNYSVSKRTRQGMSNYFTKGRHLSKPPKGYKIVDKELLPGDDADEIQEIFQELLDSDISLNQLAKKHKMTATGMKKLLRNVTYIGKVKFANEISNGNHKPLIDSTLFNKVQDKIKELGWS